MSVNWFLYWGSWGQNTKGEWPTCPRPHASSGKTTIWTQSGLASKPNVFLHLTTLLSPFVFIMIILRSCKSVNLVKVQLWPPHFEKRMWTCAFYRISIIKIEIPNNFSVNRHSANRTSSQSQITLSLLCWLVRLCIWWLVPVPYLVWIPFALAMQTELLRVNLGAASLSNCGGWKKTLD